MTNNLVLPLLALILAILAALFPFKRGDEPPPSLRDRVREIRSGFILTAFAVLLFSAAFMLWPGTFGSDGSIALAFGIGALVGAFSAAADANRGAFAFGMAVLGASLLHLSLFKAESIALAQVAFVTGAFVAAFATGGLRTRLSGGYLCVLSALFIVAADFLGRARGGSEVAASAGVVLGLAFLTAAVISGAVSRFTANVIVHGGIGFAALLLLGYLACSTYLGSPDLANLWLGGVVVGGVVHLILAGETQPESFRFVLSVVIWLGAATVAFGINQGYGMAVMLLGGAAVLILLGNIRGLMTLSVAASILVYRIFREIYPEEARALDIGQHYTMIGIAIGALLPLLPLEWGRARELAGWRAFVALSLWLAILLGLPLAAAVLLGSKGAIGMVVGLSFAAVIEGLRGAVSLAPVGLATGLGCLTVLSYDWLGDWTDLERGAKVRAVVIVAVVILAFSAALFGLSRNQAPSPENQ